MALVVATDVTLELGIMLKNQVVQTRHCANGAFHSILVNVHLLTVPLDQIIHQIRPLDLPRFGFIVDVGFNSRNIWCLVRTGFAGPAFKSLGIYNLHGELTTHIHPRPRSALALFSNFENVYCPGNKVSNKRGENPINMRSTS